ncbi:MAG TPA: divalent-cation tolerance protein CutA [Saprospiraceae bacterium]|nr:divalent-cation tolerance protein CutA [Saprospiraceae bacterium]
MQILLFYIPAGTNEEAASLGQIAVEKRFAACANIFPVQSIYPWEGMMQNENEFVLMLKTMPYLKNRLMDFISQHHSYENPCILSWNCEVNKEYAMWMMENVIEE